MTKILTARQRQISKRDLAIVREYLALGLPLEFRERGSVRKFGRGQITDQILSGKWVRTTHLMANPSHGHVCLNGEALAELAVRARERMPRKDQLLAEQATGRDAFLSR